MCLFWTLNTIAIIADTQKLNLLLLGWAVGWQPRDKLVRERSEDGSEKRRGFQRSTPGGYDTGESEVSYVGCRSPG